jgi:DNA-binding LytR/AlgR family response regulator
MGGITMRIAICDDEKNFLMYVKECVVKITFNIKDEIYIDTYTSCVDLLKHYQDYDILILDIKMPELNGVELAEKIRKENETIRIIFLTSIIQYVFEAYKVSAFRYVMKSKLRELLPEAVLKAYENINLKANQMFAFSFKGITYNIPIFEILYFEFNVRIICVYTKHTKYQFYGKLSDLELQLKNYNFVRIHSAFLVNISEVKTLSNNKVILFNDKILPISKYRYLNIKNEYYNHLRKEVLI